MLFLSTSKFIAPFLGITLAIVIVNQAIAESGPARQNNTSKDVVLARDTPLEPLDSQAAASLSASTSLGMIFGELGLSILKQDQSAQNQISSPFGVASILGILQLGASGQTQQELGNFLEPSIFNGSLMSGQMPKIRESLSKSFIGIEFVTANRIWIDQSLAKSINPDFIKSVSQVYLADGATWNFSNSSETSNKVNEWVAFATHDKIKKIITPEKIPPNTLAIATNAIYLKGVWSQPFIPQATRQLPFFPGLGKSVQVSTMNANLNIRAGTISGMQVLEIPYGKGEFCMMIAMPDDSNTTLESMMKKINGQTLLDWRHQLVEGEINLQLPKFRIEPTPFSLREYLMASGIKTPFSAGANFERLVGKNDLVLDNIYHASGIVVDETGSEASAATIAVARSRGISIAVKKS